MSVDQCFALHLTGYKAALAKSLPSLSRGFGVSSICDVYDVRQKLKYFFLRLGGRGWKEPGNPMT